MPVIINIPTGDVYYTYPPEIQEQIRLYQMRGFEELYSAFLILDAVYKSKYKIAPRHHKILKIRNRGFFDFTGFDS